MPQAHKYTMTISRLTVDKLGVKLYDRVSAVIAELIANSYDADARSVRIEAPMGQLLAVKAGANLKDKGFTIVVEDDGHGMLPDEVNPFYLRLGAERRKDPDRGETSRKLKRKVMGRKGVGKLAPFGICKSIEVISSSGDVVTGKDAKGKPAKGYRTAHFFLEREKILSDVDENYHPKVGELDETVRAKLGTRLVLRDFDHRHVPDLEDFARQISQRFGIQSADWKITLVDTTKGASDPERERIVGAFDIETMDGTLVEFVTEPAKKGKKAPIYKTVGHDGEERGDIPPGIDFDGTFYPVTGWVGYSKQPYKDDLMAGVRIYCRGKIASQTSIFNRKAGFTGEHGIRSYLVGEINADWLDTDEDLIQTDRRDILWSHPLGEALQDWGQRVVVLLGRVSRDPLRKKSWDAFLEASNLEARLAKAFPAEDQAPIREGATTLAKMIAQTIRIDELKDQERIESVVQLTMNLAPHVTLSEKLREAADAANSPLEAISGILRTARIAELSAFGLIADERVKVIHRVEELKDDAETLEAAMQDLITQAPWLVDPQWSPIVANQTFATLKAEFAKLYKKETGHELTLTPVTKTNKRADFVMAPYEGIIQLIEIKRPDYKLVAEDFDRINTYKELMDEFLVANPAFKKQFADYHITLVCDSIGLKGVHKTAFDALVEKGRMTHMNWRTFLLKTRKMHEDFLREAERQKRHAAKAT